VVGVGVGVIMGTPARLKLGNWIGIILGTVGVAALVGLDVAGSDLIAVAQLGLVVLGYAFGPAILARFMSDLPGIGVVAASLALAAIIYVPIVTILGSWPTEVPSVAVVGSVLGLGVICSALAFVLMFALVGEIGPMRMSTITYVNPAVAIIAGAIVLGEKITIVTVIGFVLVIGGAYLVTRRRAPEIPADPDAAPVVAKIADRDLQP
jgi:drug/metabolite transporter (DMT)-like permease